MILFIALLSIVRCSELQFSWNESKEWDKLRGLKLDHTHDAKSDHSDPKDSSNIGSSLIHLPVYISLTTIANRLHLLAPTLESIVTGSVLPDMIYVFVSTEAYLIDTGISDDDLINPDMNLVALLDIYPNIQFIYTENIGPHRKLMPLLKKKFDEDCVIISVDDDHLYPGMWLRDMLAYYVHSEGGSIISSRARRLAICSGSAPYEVAPYMHYADLLGE